MKRLGALWAISVICLLGILIYSNTLHNPFVFDDDPSITKNAAIRKLARPGDIWDFWPTRFVTYLTFAINYRLGGLDTTGYHIFNIVVHCASACAVCWLALLTLSTPLMKREMIATRFRLGFALFAGLIFVAHPVQTQAVTYIVQRAASLATLFFIVSLAFYAKARLAQEEGGSRNSPLPLYLASFVTAMIAYFTKEMTLTLPFMMLVYEMLFFRTKKAFGVKNCAPFLVTILVVPLTMIMTKSVNIEEMRRMSEGATTIPHATYILTQCRVVITYMRLLFLPVRQNLDYDYPVSHSVFEVPVLAGLLLVAALLTAAFKISPRHRLASFGIFWSFLALLPESGVIPIKDVIFEHRLYLPMAGFSIFLASGAYYLFGKTRQQYAIAILAVLVAVYAAMAYQRNFVWKDALTLWNDAAIKSPHKARPYCNRGIAYADRKEYDKAISDYERSLEINPHYAQAYYNRGNVYYDTKEYQRAAADYDRAVALNVRYAKAYYNRGNIYFDIGAYDKAISDFTEALAIDPIHAKAYNNRGIAHANLGDYGRAIDDFDAAIRINPAYAEAYNNRATAYYFKGDLEHSRADIQKAQVLGFTVNPRFLDDLKKASVSYEK